MAGSEKTIVGDERFRLIEVLEEDEMVRRLAEEVDPGVSERVDRGPDLWAVAFAAGIVSLSIAIAIVVGSVI